MAKKGNCKNIKYLFLNIRSCDGPPIDVLDSCTIAPQVLPAVLLGDGKWYPRLRTLTWNV